MKMKKRVNFSTDRGKFGGVEGVKKLGFLRGVDEFFTFLNYPQQIVIFPLDKGRESE